MNDLQRTPEWYLARQGKITASECYLLFQNGRSKDAVFSQTCMTYLAKRISTYYYTEDAYLEYCEMTQMHNKAVEWGVLFEPDARARFTEATGIEVSDAPFIPLTGYEKFAGGSPDGITEEERGIIEIKCPFSPEIHMQHYRCKDLDEFKKSFVQYYAQMQMNMLCMTARRETICGHCYFISFDPRTSYDKQLSVMRIPRDVEYQALLIERIKLAVGMYRTAMEDYDSVNAIELTIKDDKDDNND